MRVGIAGITGRMGEKVAEEVAAAGAFVVGGLSRSGGAAGDIEQFVSIGELASVCDVIIDFTHASSAENHADVLRGSGCSWILGTTGLAAAAQDAVGQASLHIAIVQAANFSAGVHTILAVARQLGAALPASSYDAEILEMHHRHKRDAPSGTALAIGEAVAGGRGGRLAELRIAAREGDGGVRRDGGIGFASLRGGQIVGEHSLVLTADDEQIVLTHRALDRRAFARGAVRAALWSEGRPPGLYGMADVLGIDAGSG